MQNNLAAASPCAIMNGSIAWTAVFAWNYCEPPCLPVYIPGQMLVLNKYPSLLPEMLFSLSLQLLGLYPSLDRFKADF